MAAEKRTHAEASADDVQPGAERSEKQQKQNGDLKAENGDSEQHRQGE